MPANKGAFLTASKTAPLEVLDVPYSSPGPDEVVIKSHAVAINPVDWKMQDWDLFVPEYPYVFGCDVAGVVEEVGASNTRFKKGDRVISNAVVLLKGKEYAAFQNYVKSPMNVTALLPDNMSIEEGCVLPLAVNTAALGLFGKDSLDLPLPSLNPKPSDKAVFIYGGSTSVGSTAIQLAKAAGVYVVTTASKHNFEHCTALGADHVIDYNDADWVDQAAKALDGKHTLGAYDTISHADTTQACAKLLSQIQGKSSIITTNPPPDGVEATAVFGAKMTEDEKLSKAVWQDYLEPALAQGRIKPQPQPQVVGHGLDKIQQGIDMLKKGVSARKLVVKLD